MLDRAAIAAHLPHAGGMCLLDGVLDWDDQRIRCIAVSHCDTDNPLRVAEGLATLAGIEYAAQAAAVHGALIRGDGVTRSGVLATLKNVTAAMPWLHRIAAEIVVETTLLHSDPAGGIYDFALFANAERVLSGQFTLMFIDAATVQST